MLKVLDLFSGIGGFSLGLERTGHFQTVAFCEIEPFPQAVLRKHWLEVPIYDDVRTLTAERLRADGIAVDVICGGFPCQDISTAGKGAGIEGERSGLWSEIARLTSELRPRYVIVENVAALLNRGLERVLGDLASIGYDAEWHCIPASHIGAPHRRDRIWIVAYARCEGFYQRGQFANAIEEGGEPRRMVADGISRRPEIETAALAYACRTRREERDASSFPNLTRHLAGAIAARGRSWEPEPAICRVVDGVSNRSHRLKGLGNAVVPQIPQIIGEAIAQAEGLI